MFKKTILSAALFALVFSTVAVSGLAAETDYAGSVVKLEGSDTLYYIATDGKRYVYPNERTYKSWFNDFSEVLTITEEELAQYPLTGNIRYRPGVLLIKIQTDPKVYAISKGGILRWIKTENLARRLYGADWSMLIDDISSSFFTNYTVGEDIDDESDFDADEEVNDTDTVEKNRGLALGHLSKELRAKTVRCRAVRAQPARPGDGQPRAVPAISARVCKLNIINNSGNGDETDVTAPVISDVVVTLATSTAAITWTTDEESNSKVEYSTESLATASTTLEVSDDALVTSHSLELTDLTAGATYYFIVKSADAASNIASTTEDSFIAE